MEVDIEQLLAAEPPRTYDELIRRLRNGVTETELMGDKKLSKILEVALLVAEISGILKDKDYAKSARET